MEDWVASGAAGRRLVRLLVLLAIGLAAGWPGATAARADGDPASDVLLSKPVFLGAQTTTDSPAQRELTAVVQAANRAGYGIRVAIVSSDYNLGSITALWHRPRVYARFLGYELSLAYHQRLLVAMPNGFGFFWAGHPTTAAYRALAAVPIGLGGAGLPAAAQVAVVRLAAAQGIKLAPAQRAVAPQPRAGSASTGSSIVLYLVAAALLVAAAGVSLWWWARRRPRSQRAEAPAAARLTLRPAVVGWVVLGGLVVTAVAAGVSHMLRTTAAATIAPARLIAPPQVSWPAGRRAAPEFALRDQNGRPVSVAAFRGRPVIVTFIDPLCRTFCPLEAQTLNHVVGRLPAAQRPAILAVSVDIYADTRPDMLLDDRQWQLVPQWHWAVGRPGALAAAWKRYEIGVRVVTRRIAGTTLRSITHTEVAFLIDASGHMRAMFLWPFYPADIEHELRAIA